MTRFRAEPASQYLPFTQRVCLNCQGEFTADALIVTFYAEDEPVGFVCSSCVSSDTRELLRRGGLVSGKEGTTEGQMSQSSNAPRRAHYPRSPKK